MSNDTFDTVESTPETTAAEEQNKDTFNVWSTLLLISLICVTIACILLILELRSFSNFPFSYPWNTSN